MRRNHGKEIRKGILYFLVLVLSINLGIGLVYQEFLHEEDEEEAWILVPGAALDDLGEPSPMLADRLDGAVQLYQKKPRSILVSGRSDEDNNETKAMVSYLLDQGIPREDILVDDQGNRTFTTMKNAKQFHDKFIISTQKYHMGRCIFLARCVGLEATAAPLPNRNMDFLGHNHMRERMARVLAFFEGTWEYFFTRDGQGRLFY